MEYRPAAPGHGNLMVEASMSETAECGGQRLCWERKTTIYTPQDMKERGIDITNAADRALLTLPIRSPQVIARFRTLPIEHVIQDFLGSTVIQALRLIRSG